METCWSCLHVSIMNSFLICMGNWPVASCSLEWHSLESQTNWGQASRMCRDDSTFFRSWHKRKVDIKLRSWRGRQLWLNSVLWLRSNFIIFSRWHLKVVEPIAPRVIYMKTNKQNQTKLLSQLVNLANNSRKVSWCLVSTKPWQETTFYILTA